MTAPLRASDPITVNVALGDRAYDIAIGRGLLATLGERIAKLRPGCKVAIITGAARGQDDAGSRRTVHAATAEQDAQAYLLLAQAAEAMRNREPVR